MQQPQLQGSIPPVGLVSEGIFTTRLNCPRRVHLLIKRGIPLGQVSQLHLFPECDADFVVFHDVVPHATEFIFTEFRISGQSFISERRTLKGFPLGNYPDILLLFTSIPTIGKIMNVGFQLLKDSADWAKTLIAVALVHLFIEQFVNFF